MTTLGRNTHAGNDADVEYSSCCCGFFKWPKKKKTFKSNGNSINTDYNFSFISGATITNSSINSIDIQSESEIFTLKIYGEVGCKSVIDWCDPVELHKHVHNHARVESTSGGINMKTAGSDVVIKSSSGTIKATKIGDRCEMSASSGTVHAKSIGDDSRVETRSGDININVVGARSTITAMSGLIDASSIGSDCVLETRSGSIHSKYTDPSTRASSKSGTVKLN